MAATRGANESGTALAHDDWDVVLALSTHSMSDPRGAESSPESPPKHCPNKMAAMSKPTIIQTISEKRIWANVQESHYLFTL